MKIKNLIFSIFIVGIILNSAFIVYFASTKVNEIGDTTASTGSDTLMKSSNQNLMDIAAGYKDSLDSQLQNQYIMVKTWAKTPTLLETSKLAQTKTKEELYELWSAESTRVYDEGEATGDGNPANDLNPTASNYLISLSKTTNIYPEIFTTDNRGYAVAANVATGDFDQGPEDWRVFLDETGKPYFKMLKPGLNQEAWYYAANQAPDGFYISKVIYDESSKTWGLELVSQMRNPSSNEYLGQIKAVLDFSQFINNIVNLKEIDINSVRIVTNDGKIIASYDKEGTVKTESTTLESVGDSFLNEIKKGETSGVFTETLNGVSSITAYKVSNDKNKYVVAVSKDKNKINQPIDNFVNSLRMNINNKGNELQGSILLIAVIVGLVTIVVALWFINKQILDPLHKMSTVADKLTNGDFDVDMPNIKTNNELQKFSALTAMLVSIIKQNKEEKSGKKK